MKKSSFVAMIMGTVGGILSAIGMCMVLVTDWNAFTPGIIMGSIGLVVLLAMVLVRRNRIWCRYVHGHGLGYDDSWHYRRYHRYHRVTFIDTDG